MSQNQMELYKNIRDLQNKITYFLMTAAGAGIGFSVTQTKDSWLGANHVLLGTAVVFWGVSFFFGCKYIHSVTFHLVSNFHAIGVGNKSIKNEADHIALQFFREKMDSTNKTANRYFNSQFWTLILGAVSFIGWHVLEMYLRANSPTFGN